MLPLGSMLVSWLRLVLCFFVLPTPLFILPTPFHHDHHYLSSDRWGVSLARVSVCMPWSPTQIAGCSACFDVPPHSKLQGASVSSEETESGRTSPVLTDPVIFSPRRQQNRRSECVCGAREHSLCWVPTVAEYCIRGLRVLSKIMRK